MSRRGFTLIEMLAAMTVGSVMLGIAVGMLHVLLRAERTGRERVHQARFWPGWPSSSAATSTRPCGRFPPRASGRSSGSSHCGTIAR